MDDIRRSKNDGVHFFFWENGAQEVLLFIFGHNRESRGSEKGNKKHTRECMDAIRGLKNLNFVEK